MRRVAVSVLIAAMIAAPASAAPKGISVGLGSIYSAPIGIEGMVQSGKNLIYISNTNSATADIVLTAIDLAGTQVWQRTIDSAADEVFTAATVDYQGNIWLAGAAGLVVPAETATIISGVDNPDNVVSESATALRADMNQLALWKISPSGELTATYLSPQSMIPIPSAISATNSGISIVGQINSHPFFNSVTSAGTFGKLVSIGTSKSEFNNVVRHADGTSTIFGSSAEVISGQKVAGLRDGILLRVSKFGAVTKLIRSSAQKASRSWISGDAQLLTSGPVITGKITETAITKFNSSLAPTWTLRLPSTGQSVTLSANGNSYLAFTSKSAITGIAQWRPTAPALLVITFDSKGALKAATALPGLVTPLSLQYSKERGITGLASSSDGTVSIFTLVSR